MTEHIYPKKIDGKTYYYLQSTWREKINKQDHGTKKSSGKSRVRTKSKYLGTVKSIKEQLEKTRSPIEVAHREFGFVAAVYQTAVELGLVDLLKQHIPGTRNKVHRWLYFMLPIINRLQLATSKEKMGDWAAGTVLPDILGFDPKRLNSRSFWYATDDVISEKELNQRRASQPDLNDELFVGLDDAVFKTIENKIFTNLREKFGISSDIVLYDTTNFFTYIEEPVRSLLARTGHNKDCHHHLRQVGLAMCVEKEWGIPLFHRIYRGNAHDSKVFPALVDELIDSLKAGFEQVDQLVLVLDKGNNSQENFVALADKIKWVGSLILSHFTDLIDLPLTRYVGEWEKYKFYHCNRKVMGINCLLVLTYNATLARKQEHSLNNGIKKLKGQVIDKWKAYKRRPKSVTPGINSLIKESRCGKYITVGYNEGTLELEFTETEAVAEKKKKFGKNLLFCNDQSAECGWIITQYHSKDFIEDGFKLLKDPELIRWRPSRHWTDTKIRVFGFCCIMALVLIRIMQLKADKVGLKMSPAVLKEELTDLKEVVMIYKDMSAETKISRRSTVQQRLWNLFSLGTVENQLTLH